MWSCIWIRQHHWHIYLSMPVLQAICSNSVTVYLLPALVVGNGPIRSIPTLTTTKKKLATHKSIEAAAMYVYLLPNLRLYRNWMELCWWLSKFIINSLAYITSFYELFYITSHVRFPIKSGTYFVKGFITTQVTTWIGCNCNLLQVLANLSEKWTITCTWSMTRFQYSLLFRFASDTNSPRRIFLVWHPGLTFKVQYSILTLVVVVDLGLMMPTKQSWFLAQYYLY